MGALQQIMLMVAAGAVTYDDIQYISQGLSASGTGAITVPMPNAYINNDILVMFVESANQAITTPSGWTQVTNSPQSTGTAAAAGGVRLGVFYRIATGSLADVSVADTGDHTYGVILCFRKVDTTTPIDSSVGGVLATAGTTVTLSAITTVVDKVLVLLCVGNDRDSTLSSFSAWTNANLSSVTERFDGATSSGVGGGVGVASGVKATAGSTGTSTVTNAASVTAAHMTIGLKPTTGYSNARVITVSSLLTADSIGTDSNAGFTLNTDGSTSITANDNITANTFANWYGSVTGGIGSSFWVRATLVSGALATGTTGSWLALSTARTWSVSAVYVPLGSGAGADVKLEFASDSGGTTIVGVMVVALGASTSDP